MTDVPQDHTSIKDIREQFEREATEESNTFAGRVVRRKDSATSTLGTVGQDRPQHGTSQDRPQHGTGQDRPQHGTGQELGDCQEPRPSIKIARDSQLVQRITQRFEDGQPAVASGGGTGSGHVAALSRGSPTRQAEVPKKPVTMVTPVQGRPPLPSKPSSGDSKPRSVASKSRMFETNEKSPGRTSMAIAGAGKPHDSTNISNSVASVAHNFEPNSYPDERTYESITGDAEPTSQIKSSQHSGAAQQIVRGKAPSIQQPGNDPSEFYSKVDMTKKKKYRESQPDWPGRSRGDSLAADDGGGDYALLRVSVSSSGGGSDTDSGIVSPRSPSGPLKPPRTFAHDEYLAQKELRKQQKRMTRELEQRGRLQNVGEYEEIHNTEVSGSPVKSGPKASANQRLPSSSGVKCEVSRRPSERPPPPPRPPPSYPRQTIAGPIVGDPKRREKAFVQVLKHNEKQSKEAFLSRGKVTNPSYETDWQIIRIKSPQNDAPAGLKRSRSDECLYAEPGSHSEPVYSEPVDRVGVVPGSAPPHGQQHPVKVDSEGYAIPDTSHTPPHGLGRQNTMIDGRARHKCDTLAGKNPYVKKSQHHMNMTNCGPGVHMRAINRKRPQVQEKLSRAYSVLRISQQAKDGAGADNNDRDDKEDSDNEVDADEHKKRLIYVSTVKMRLSIAVQQSPRKIPLELTMNLFNYAALIGLESTDDIHRCRTKSLFSFPQQDASTLSVIAQFCFPDLQIWRPVSRYQSETFSFVLTDEKARRKYGYCKRFLPPGNGNRLPVVCCVVSALDAFTFYKKLLDDAKEKMKISQDHTEMLLQAAYAVRIPDPGQEAWISTMTIGDKKETLFIKRPEDTRQENVSFDPLLTNLSVENLIKIFASVLLERKIIFVAQHLSTLTSCIHGLCALLYPFAWPHPFVPVLPEGMLGVCATPTPILIGVLTSVQPKLADIPIDEVLMIDLDHNTLMMSQGDEGRIIPKKLQKALKLALKEDGDTTSSHDILVMESFLRFFVETIGHYTEYICTQMDGEKIFEKKSFITSVSSKSIRMFLEWFTETQMFEMFITDRMENMESTGMFENRIQDYREEMSESPNIKQNMKIVGRKMIDFFIASGDKLRKTFSRNVFI